MKVLSWAACALGAGSVAACASIPDATVRYHLPRAETSVKVVRSVICDANMNLVVANAVLAPTAYVADYDRPHEFALARLQGALVDPDINFNLTDDGRLKGVNATLTGKGEEVIKAASGLIASAKGVGLLNLAPTGTTPCEYIKLVGGGKPINLTYSRLVTYAAGDFAPGLEIPIDPDSLANQAGIGTQLPGPFLTVVRSRDIKPPVDLTNASSRTKGLPMLKATSLAVAELVVSGARNGGDEIWRQRVIIPVAGEYDVPVPKGAPFGTSSFILAIGESGSVTQLKYGRTNGAAGALNTANAVLGDVSSTTKEQADALKAEADLIVQQQRVATCKADPANCK